MRNLRPILLVENNRADAMTVEQALKDIKVTNPLVHVVNGGDALGYLSNENNKKPCIILLGLNMPGMNGIEFLKARQKMDRLKLIPVVVFTASREGQDIAESFQLGAAGYMVKPVDYKKFVEVVKTIEIYWRLSELPNGG